VALLSRIVREVPQVASIKEEAVPTAPRIRALAAAMKERKVPVLTGLGALYGLFDLEAGSSGFNTGFAFPEGIDSDGKPQLARPIGRGFAKSTRVSCR